MSTFPLPLDSYAEFEALFQASTASGPASLPVASPTKPFWSHPGLSKDWPIRDDGSDPEGAKSTNPYARSGSEGALTEEADLVIIGSGITGVSIALELSRLVRKVDNQRMKVVILEARDFCTRYFFGLWRYTKSMNRLRCYWYVKSLQVILWTDSLRKPGMEGILQRPSPIIIQA